MPTKGTKKTHCVRGHDKRVVGTAGNGWCRECRRLSYAKRGLTAGLSAHERGVNFRKPFCPNGHDKRVVGVTKGYACKECLREKHDANYWREWRRSAGNKRAGLPEGMALDRFTPLPNLRGIRLRTGMTQKEMAGRIGLNPHHYGELEAGRKQASRQTVALVLEAISDAGVRAEGRYRKLCRAALEAERRGEPTLSEMAGILRERPATLRWPLWYARSRGLIERFDGGAYLITEAGHELATGLKGAT
jgi:transcriptional regulator with XRE-family HTH domain